MGYPTRLTRLTDNLHVWAPSGTGTWGLANCALVTSGGQAALIDTPYTAALAEQLMAAAQPLLPAGSAISVVVNTHANGDHSYTNGLYPEAAVIGTLAGQEHADLEPTPEAMHELVHAANTEEPLGWYLNKHFGRFDYSGLMPCPPNQTFSGELSVQLGEIEMRLIEVGPAHTVGDLIVYLPEQQTVCAGDIVFAGDHPVHWAGPLDNIVRAVETILDLEPRFVVPGHGPILFGLADVYEYGKYLRYVRDRIHALHEGGLSVQQAAADLFRDDMYPDLGLPERLVTLTYMEYWHLDGAIAGMDIMGRLAEAARFAYCLDQGGLTRARVDASADPGC